MCLIGLKKIIILVCFLSAGVFAFERAWAVNGESKKEEGDVKSSQIEIDRVDVVGVKAFPSQQIESVLAIVPGDRLERVKVLRTEENLQALYLSHGYEEVKIRSRLLRKKAGSHAFETLLEFQVLEGNPVRIFSVQVIPIEMSDVVLRGVWKKQESQIRSSIHFKPGDIFDKEIVSQNKRAIQEVLASNEYVGAKVEVVEEEVHPPAQALGTLAKMEEGSRWIKLVYRVSLGDWVSFGFRGNTVFTWGHLQSLVAEQRLLGLGKDYIGVIRSRIESEYHLAGYSQVEISSYSVEGHLGDERKVTYGIQEGPRVKIDSVEFDGNFVFTSKELRRLFFSRAPALVSRGVYVEKEVQKAAELVIDGMKEKGYLSAKLVTINTVYKPKLHAQKHSNAVQLMVYLYEGDQTVVQNIAIEGASLLSQEKIQNYLKVKHHEPLNLFSFAEGLEMVKKTYRDQGYLSFQVVNEGSESLIEYAQENRVANIHLKLEEGPQFRASRIEFDGLEITQEAIVKRELEIQEGGVVGELALVESERKLRKMGIFSSVEIHALDDSESEKHKVIRVLVKEADRGILTGGPGLRNDLGLRGYGQFSYTNFWGLGHSASVNLSVNRRFYLYNFAEGQAQILYQWPWFMGLPEVVFRPAVSVGRTQFNTFASDNITVSGNWEKQILPKLVGNLNYSLEQFRQFNVPYTDDLNAKVGSITPKLTLDLRDNSLVPTSGIFLTTSCDFADPSIGSQSDISYIRPQFRGDWYLNLVRDIVFSFSFRTGYEVGQKIPLIKLFMLGGVASVKGYQELEVNLNNVYPTLPGPNGTSVQTLSGDGSLVGHSLSFVNYRTQLDLPFAGPIKFGLFLDAANFLLDSYSFEPQFFGVGAGLHFQSPIGPVNGDVGFPIKALSGTGKNGYVLHFSVGIL